MFGQFITVLLIAASYFAVFLLFALFMEFFAWFSHKYIMHGILWIWHKDHHIPHKGKLEKNDLFVLVFASPAILSIVLGALFSQPYAISAGLGISAYGIAYVLFHDIMFHRRIKRLPLHRLALKYDYFASIVNAHRQHHRHNLQYDAEAFGFLYPPVRYRVQLKKKE
jgi:beta-carotene 3-hydroxylase